MFVQALQETYIWEYRHNVLQISVYAGSKLLLTLWYASRD